MTRLRALWISCRPRQWIKNGFVLLPLVFGREVFEPSAWVRIAAACLGFCIVSSAVYLMNDVADRTQDRQHPFKRRRPVASGALPIPLALACGFGGAAVGILGAFRLQTEFGVIICLYLALNVLYGRWLRTVVILDVFCVSLFYVLRVTAGIFVLPVPVSYWMLLLTALLALFLALQKRRYELVQLQRRAAAHRAALTHYTLPLIDQMSISVTAAIFIVYILFVLDPAQIAKLGSHNMVYTIPLVAYGVFRYQYLVERRGRGGDSAEIVLTDRPMLATLLLWVLVCGLAMYSTGEWVRFPSRVAHGSH